jgi:hypothetical protein
LLITLEGLLMEKIMFSIRLVEADAPDPAAQQDTAGMETLTPGCWAVLGPLATS